MDPAERDQSLLAIYGLLVPSIQLPPLIEAARTFDRNFDVGRSVLYPTFPGLERSLDDDVVSLTVALTVVFKRLAQFIERPSRRLAEKLREALADYLECCGLLGSASEDILARLQAADPVVKPQNAAGTELARGLASENGDASETPVTYHVFLSYNSDDRPVVDELAKKLESEGLAVWVDTKRLVSGEHWQNGIGMGIDCSSSVGVCIGPTKIEHWQKEETQYALNRATRDKRFKVIPVLLPGAPAKPELPFPLGNRQWVDFRNGFNPDELNRLVRQIKGTSYSMPDSLERDAWVYEQRKAGRTIPEIKAELKENKHGWWLLDSDRGVRDAWERYADHFGLPRPRVRAGRPRRRK